jgi:hypothetical protein
MVILDFLGLTFDIIPSDQLAAAVSCSMIGAYAVFTGVDFFARTGYIELADSFINSKSDFNGQDRSHDIHHMFTILIVLLAIAGTVFQRIYGDRKFTFDKDGRRNAEFCCWALFMSFDLALLSLLTLWFVVAHWDKFCDVLCMCFCPCVPRSVRKCCCCGGGEKLSLDHGYDSE